MSRRKNKLPGTLGRGLACDSKVVFIKALRRLSRSLSKLGQGRAMKTHDQQKETNQIRNKKGPKKPLEPLAHLEEQLAPLDTVLFYMHLELFWKL